MERGKDSLTIDVFEIVNDRNQQEFIYKSFEKLHPQLMKLKPNIVTSTIIGEHGKPNQIIIELRHDFVFDNRLVCSEINGISVFNIVVGKAYPDMFFEKFVSGDPIPLYKLEAPENYVEYVNKNIEQIRVKLLAPNMSIDEALDAIVPTGDFQTHIQNVNHLKALFHSNPDDI